MILGLTIKEAAAQVDYKIDELSDRQKQILIGLFVDKVEVSKTYDENGKRNVKAKVIFRFNPQHMKEQLIGVSTESWDV